MKPTVPAHIETELRELCLRRGVTVIEFLVRGSEQKAVAEVYVDSPSGITLDECGALSQEIGDLFERESAFAGAYRLDVSSPGVDRPLQYSWQYERNTGRLLSVRLQSGATLVGRLAAVGEATITLEPTKKRGASAPKQGKTGANDSADSPVTLPAEFAFAEIRSAFVLLEA